MAYREISENKTVVLKPEGGETTLSYYAGNKNNETNSVENNADALNITYHFDTALTWINSVSFTNKDKTAKYIIIKYDANTDGESRSINLKLKNQTSLYHLILTLESNDNTLPATYKVPKFTVFLAGVLGADYDKGNEYVWNPATGFVTGITLSTYYNRDLTSVDSTIAKRYYYPVTMSGKILDTYGNITISSTGYVSTVFYNYNSEFGTIHSLDMNGDKNMSVFVKAIWPSGTSNSELKINYSCSCYIDSDKACNTGAIPNLILTKDLNYILVTLTFAKSNLNYNGDIYATVGVDYGLPEFDVDTYQTGTIILKTLLSNTNEDTTQMNVYIPINYEELCTNKAIDIGAIGIFISQKEPEDAGYTN